MNKIIVQRRSSAIPPSMPAVADTGWLARNAALILSALLLGVLLISFEPFNVPPPDAPPLEPSGPNIVNQIGFGLIGLISMGAMMLLADRHRLWAAIDPAWTLVLLFLFLAALQAPEPGAALRTAAFSLTVILGSLAVIALPWTEANLRKAAGIAILLTILLSYAGLVLLPEAAIHGSGEPEPQHDGLWRGVFSHKNVAGPAFAAFFYFGIYLLRSGDRWVGWAITFLSLLFVFATGSRTTGGLVIIACVIVLAGRLFDSRRLPVFLLLLALAGAFTLTLGVVFFPSLGQLAEQFTGDATFTGRTTLWAYGIEAIKARPWTGYGLDGFWLTPLLTDAVLPFDFDWDIRRIVHGHNNYIDMALFMGLPGLSALLWLIAVRPLVNFLRCSKGHGSVLLADLGLMILAFMLLNSLLESTWFRRADPSWVMTIIAVASLRLARHGWERKG